MGAGNLTGLLSLLSLPLVCTLAAAQGGDRSAVALWCVAKNNAADADLQAAINWACGPGQVDCGPIQVGGPCYYGSDLVRTASYVFNAYYHRNGPSDEACNFSNNAALTSIDPSHGNCRFASSTSSSSGNGNNSVPVAAGNTDMSNSGSSLACHWDLGLIVILAILLIL